MAKKNQEIIEEEKLKEYKIIDFEGNVDIIGLCDEPQLEIIRFLISKGYIKGTLEEVQ
jgi:hypothetical protein